MSLLSLLLHCHRREIGKDHNGLVLKGPVHLDQLGLILDWTRTGKYRTFSPSPSNFFWRRTSQDCSFRTSYGPNQVNSRVDLNFS